MDVYEIVVSEFMLQQTRVDTVLPYFERWLEAFPTLEALAAASVDDVLVQWSGLGYYRRAAHLHELAGRVVREHGGRVPSRPADLRELPGIGPYAAGAIASLAYGVREPAIDGNAQRVLARVFGIADDVTRAIGRGRVDAAARRLVAQGPPGEVNSAVMELGARLCTPRAPDCPACPIGRWCRARAQGRAEELPRRPARPRSTRVSAWAMALRHPGRDAWLVARRGSGLLSGMWEIPLAEGATRPAWPVSVGDRAEVGEVRHVFSHRTLCVRVETATTEGDDALESMAAHYQAGEARPPGAAYDAWRWADASEWAALPTSVLARKLMERALSPC